MKNEEKKKAVAIKYDHLNKENKAPYVVAKGYNKTAEEIIKIAKENEVAIHEDKDLVELLIKVDLNDEIPEELYEVVAEVLSFVYNMNNKFKTKDLHGK
jgi:flagellar biosynthesis protein